MRNTFVDFSILHLSSYSSVPFNSSLIGITSNESLNVFLETGSIKAAGQAYDSVFQDVINSLSKTNEEVKKNNDLTREQNEEDSSFR